MHFLGRKQTSFEGSCLWPKALGGVGWRVKGLWIWTGMHFWGRKQTSFEGSCIWPKASGGVGWRVKGLWIWTSMHLLGRKLTSFEGLAFGPKPWGVAWRVKGLWMWTGKALRKTGCGREKNSACQLAFHGSRKSVEMFFCRRLAYVSRRVKFFSRWRLRALSYIGFRVCATLNLVHVLESQARSSFGVGEQTFWSTALYQMCPIPITWLE